MWTTRLIMGMPITVAIGGDIDGVLAADVFDYFDRVDRRFSTYRSDSEVEAVKPDAGLDVVDRAVEAMREAEARTELRTEAA